MNDATARRLCANMAAFYRRDHQTACALPVEHLVRRNVELLERTSQLERELAQLKADRLTDARFFRETRRAQRNVGLFVSPATQPFFDAQEG